MKTLTYAPDAWKYLNGVFCIYKPAGLTSRSSRKIICNNLCRDLNELEQRENSGLVLLKGSVFAKKPYEVRVQPNLAEHEFVSGPRYQSQDVRLKWVSAYDLHTSGVSLMAINDGCKQLKNPLYSSLLRKYEIRGKFGSATDTFLSDGKVTERSSYSHVKRGSLDRVLSSLQASFQTLTYEYCGVDIESQAAYELASTGYLRPSAKSGPVIYSIKCTDFKLPFFTVVVLCVQETESYLAELIHDIGIDLRTTATITQLHVVQFGHFTLAHALLRKHWTLENILNNLTLCKAVLEDWPDSQDFRHIQQSKQNGLIEAMQNRIREEYI